MLVRAGERAASLAAAAEARRYFEQAIALTGDDGHRAALLHQAGEMATRAAQPDRARLLFEQSIALYQARGEAHAAARVDLRLGLLEAGTGHRDEALVRLEHVLAALSDDEPDEDLAQLAASLALAHWFSGDLERAAARADLALDIAEAHAYMRPLVRALRAKSGIAVSRGHNQEGAALLTRALEISLAHDVVDEASFCYFWLSDRCFASDIYPDALGYLDESLALTRKFGSRPMEWAVLAERTFPLFMMGRWDDALAVGEEFTQEQVDSGGTVLSLLQTEVEANVQRGDLERAQRMFAMFSRLESSTDLQELSGFLACRASLHRAEGRLREALADGREAVETGRWGGISSQSVKQGIVEALEAALTLGEAEAAEELLRHIETVPPGTRPPYLDAHAKRFRARIDRDASRYAAASAIFRELGPPFWLAVTLLEHGELTGDEALLAEAREIFQQLKAAPWLDRVGAAPQKQASAVQL
jgi:tetratricopeptide (TPR) repeat protein